MCCSRVVTLVDCGGPIRLSKDVAARSPFFLLRHDSWHARVNPRLLSWVYLMRHSIGSRLAVDHQSSPTSLL